jgi:hypothetical protein
MIVIVAVIVFAICYYAAWHRARTFNRRDKAAGFRPPLGDYRTWQQRLARWK